MAGLEHLSRQRRHFSVNDFHRMGDAGILGEDEHIELIEVEILEMTPIGSPHGGHVTKLNRFARLEEGAYQVRETLDLSRPTPVPGLPQCALELEGLFR